MAPRTEFQQLLQAEREAALDDLLSRWHHWQISSSATVSHGFNSTSTGLSSYRTSRQYDTGKMQDNTLNSRECGAVEYAVSEITRRDQVDGTAHGLALRVHARALYLGTSAISNPRLPADRQELDALIAAARELLSARLVSAGVLE